MLGRLFGRSAKGRAAGRREPTAEDILHERIRTLMNRQPRPVLAEAQTPRMQPSPDEIRSARGEPIQVSAPVNPTPNSVADDTAGSIGKGQVLSLDKLTGGDSAIGDDGVRVLDRVYLSEAVVQGDRPDEVVKLNTGIVAYLVQELHYRANELSAQAYQAFAVDRYLQTVLDGGHIEFLRNAQDEPDLWNSVRDGLGAIGATGFQKLFAEFSQIILDDESRVERVSAGEENSDDCEALEKLDLQLAELNQSDPLLPPLSYWLLSSPDLAVASRTDLDEFINGLAQQDAILERHEHFLEVARTRKSQDPFNRIGMAIASRAGLEFDRWGEQIGAFEADGEQWSEGWTMLTDEEPAVMVRDGEGLYALYDQASRIKLATLDIDESWELSAA